MFASKSVLEHVARGVVGFGALAAAIVLAQASGWTAVVGSTALAVFALVAMRGCPMCWTLGMVETLALKRGATASVAEDLDGERSADVDTRVGEVLMEGFEP